MVRRLHVLLICSAAVLVLVAGCGAKRAPQVNQESPLSPVAQEIQRRGYRAKESRVVAPTPWEISTFRLRAKHIVNFRANEPMPNARDTYHRFSFFEESYDSIADARNRLANLHMPSPDTPGENEYERVMRSGFRRGTVVYVLQTDAIIFWDELKRFSRELAVATQGEELTDVRINGPAKKSSDASPNASGVPRLESVG